MSEIVLNEIEGGDQYFFYFVFFPFFFGKMEIDTWELVRIFSLK